MRGKSQSNDQNTAGKTFVKQKNKGHRDLGISGDIHQSKPLLLDGLEVLENHEICGKILRSNLHLKAINWS